MTLQNALRLTLQILFGLMGALLALVFFVTALRTGAGLNLAMAAGTACLSYQMIRVVGRRQADKGLGSPQAIGTRGLLMILIVPALLVGSAAWWLP